MSFCRWNMDSDVYVYAHVDGGITTEIAYSREGRDAPNEDLSFSDDTWEKCVARLKDLRSRGYLVPAWVVDAVSNEADRKFQGFRSV